MSNKKRLIFLSVFCVHIIQNSGCAPKNNALHITLIVPDNLPKYFMLVEDASMASKHNCDVSFVDAAHCTYTILPSGVGYASDLSPFHRWHKLWAKHSNGTKCLTTFDVIPPPKDAVLVRGGPSGGGADPRTKRYVGFTFGTLADYHDSYRRPSVFPHPK